MLSAAWPMVFRGTPMRFNKHVRLVVGAELGAVLQRGFREAIDADAVPPRLLYVLANGQEVRDAVEDGSWPAPDSRFAGEAALDAYALPLLRGFIDERRSRVADTPEYGFGNALARDLHPVGQYFDRYIVRLFDGADAALGRSGEGGPMRSAWAPPRLTSLRRRRRRSGGSKSAVSFTTSTPSVPSWTRFLRRSKPTTCRQPGASGKGTPHRCWTHAGTHFAGPSAPCCRVSARRAWVPSGNGSPLRDGRARRGSSLPATCWCPRCHCKAGRIARVGCRSSARSCTMPCPIPLPPTALQGTADDDGFRCIENVLEGIAEMDFGRQCRAGLTLRDSPPPCSETGFGCC